MGVTLGIDLGTTYSAVATLDERGRPVVLRNPLGEETTPSVVCFESPSSVLVGKMARSSAPLFPDQTVTLVKRRMGTDALFSFHGVEHTPESISALILRALVDGTVPGGRTAQPIPAVITVPAYFGIREREATQEAGLLAGLDVLELVSEPVAAAIHYGFAEDVGIGTALVYDLGGGTFDATVLRMGGRIDVVATDGDTELGGADWDQRLATYLLDEFMKQAGPEDNPADDEEFMVELGLTAERVKRELSVASVQRVPVRWRGRHVTVPVTRDEFESMTRDLRDSTVAVLRRLLTAAKAKGVTQIDHCLLVGGSSRMPSVAALLTAQFGWAPRSYDPDLAVAKGAALRAHQLLRLPVSERAQRPPARPRPPVVAARWGQRRRGSTEDTGMGTRGGADPPSAPGAVPAPGAEPASGLALAPGSTLESALAASVLPRSLGLLLEDSHDPTGQRRFVQHVVHQNDPLPAVRQESVATIVDGQQSARIQVYEQAGSVESAELDANRIVLDGALSDLPTGLRAGSPIQVTLTVGLDGRLTLTAAEPKSGRTIRVEACIDGVVDRAGRAEAARTLSMLSVRQ